MTSLAAAPNVESLQNALRGAVRAWFDLANTPGTQVHVRDLTTQRGRDILRAQKLSYSGDRLEKAINEALAPTPQLQGWVSTCRQSVMPTPPAPKVKERSWLLFDCCGRGKQTLSDSEPSSSAVVFPESPSRSSIVVQQFSFSSDSESSSPPLLISSPSDGTSQSCPARVSSMPESKDPPASPLGKIEGKMIGQGTFSTVYQVEMGAKKYALKCIDKRVALNKEQIPHLLSEKYVLETINSPFLVHGVRITQTEKELLFFQDLLPGVELFTLIQTYRRLDEAHARFYCAEVILGLEALHSVGLVYRDLKPENIKLDADNHIKLVDFGFTKLLKENERTMTCCGTPDYMAPEIWRKEPYNHKSDIWSVGVLLFEMLVGTPPFADRTYQRMQAKIMTGTINNHRVSLPGDAANLIAALLNQKPEKRPTLEQIKAHEWFAGFDWQKAAAREIEPPSLPENIKPAVDWDRRPHTPPDLTKANYRPSPSDPFKDF